MSDKTLSLPESYDDFLRNLKERIRAAQVKAALAVNHELILLYWQVGREILSRQQQAGWGAKVIERIAKDLKKEFPAIQGFSSRNLKYTRAFAEAYPDKGNDKTIVEYALQEVGKPIGVATFKLQNSLPESLRESLPSVEQLEMELETITSEVLGKDDASEAEG